MPVEIRGIGSSGPEVKAVVNWDWNWVLWKNNTIEPSLWLMLVKIFPDSRYLKEIIYRTL